MTETVLPISPEVFWGVVYTSLFFVACLAVGGLLNSVKPDHVAPLVRLKRALGLRKVNSGLFLIAMLMWSVVALLLVAGLIGTVWGLIWQAAPTKETASWDWRFALVKLTALTATLGAVVAFPITMQRLRLTQLQTSTASEALFNEKINAAANDLHAQRQVTINPENVEERADVWQDDIVKRNAAIDQLEILVQERPDTAPRVARMLCTYVRELSKEYRPLPVPKDISPVELTKWTLSLVACRSDMENAVQTLGRLQTITGVDPSAVSIDLRGANMQGFALGGAVLNDARMDSAHLQRANLHSAELKKSSFFGAGLQGASMYNTKLQGADLILAEFQGAYLHKTEMDDETVLVGSNWHGALIQEFDYSNVNFSQNQINVVYYDGSTIFSDEITRAAGREKMLGYGANNQWRKWQESIGFDPNAYQA